jgi:uncharacterized protein (DUF1499 family)
MKIRYERPVSYAASWARRFGLFAFALFVVAGGLHRFGILDSDTFATLFFLSGVLAGLAFLLAAVGLLRLWMVGARGGRASAKGLFFSIIVLVPVCIALYRAYTLPRLYDISTNTEDVPAFLDDVDHSVAWLPLIGRGNEDYSGQPTAYPEVTGRRYEGALDRVLEAVYLVAENRGIDVTNAKLPEEKEEVETAPVNDQPAELAVEITPDATVPTEEVHATESLPLEGVIDSEAAPPIVLLPVQILLQGKTRTLLFGFESDISIRLSEEAETTFVDMRSVSRFGPHDLGANAKIITEFLAALDAELLGISVK